MLVVDNLYLGERGRGGRAAARSRRTSATTPRTSGARFFEDAGLAVEEVRRFDKPIELEPWLERAGCTGEEAERVRELLADRIADGRIALDRIALKGDAA